MSTSVDERAYSGRPRLVIDGLGAPFKDRIIFGGWNSIAEKFCVDTLSVYRCSAIFGYT